MRCPKCTTLLDREQDLLDLMPDEYYVCPECGWVGIIDTIHEGLDQGGE